MGQYKTPLRYPGGKQRLWPFINEILEVNNLSGGEYAEPFAGGAGVAIELLLGKHVRKIHLNDSCPGVYSFWYSLLNDTERFCRKISRASLSIDEWKKQREIFRIGAAADRFDLGFAFFYLNRCNRSGIVNGGVIGGVNQTGKWKIDARFNRNELITRIELIAGQKSLIRLRNWDAERYILEYIPRLPSKSLVYCDPPYHKKADRLYPNHYLEEDHRDLARVIQKNIKTPWLVSYDSCTQVRCNFAAQASIEYKLQYNAGRAYKGSEIFILSDDLYLPYSSSIPFIDRVLQRIPE